jgi:hypothetical protein
MTRIIASPFVLLASAVLVACMPAEVSAMTFVQVLQLFNIFVGIFLTATILVFCTGLFVYFARLGTWPSHRDQAIQILEWGVGMLFVLVVLLAIVQWFERHTKVALSILAFVVLMAVIIFIIRAAATGGDGKKKEKKEGAAPKH